MFRHVVGMRRNEGDVFLPSRRRQEQDVAFNGLMTQTQTKCSPLIGFLLLVLDVLKGQVANLRTQSNQKHGLLGDLSFPREHPHTMKLIF